MSGRRNLRHSSQQLDVRRAVIKIIITDQAPIRLASRRTILILVHSLKDRALVPGNALVLFERSSQIRLGDIHHSDLQHLIRLRIANEMIKTSPGPLEFLEVLVVNNHIDLFRQLPVEFADQRLDCNERIVRDQRRCAQRLLRECFYRFLNR